MLDFANRRAIDFHTFAKWACAKKNDILIPLAGSNKTTGQQEKRRDAFEQAYFQDEWCVFDATA